MIIIKFLLIAYSIIIIVMNLMVGVVFIMKKENYAAFGTLLQILLGIIALWGILR
jgi:hypothetical protein